MAIKSVSIRIEQEMLDKIGYIAEYEGRSVNSHILVLVRENIKQFEKEHGTIEGNIEPDVNVKPTRKWFMKNIEMQWYNSELYGQLERYFWGNKRKYIALAVLGL